MSNYEKIFKQWIKQYSSAKGQRFRVCVPDGRGGQVRKQGFESYQIALNWTAAQFISRAEAKGQVEQTYSTATFEEFAKEWLHKVSTSTGKGRRVITAATAIKYECDLRLRILPFFARYRLIDITKSLAKSFRDRLDSDPQINGTSAQMTFALFKRILKQAEEDELIERTGISELSGPVGSDFRPDHWDEREIDTFLAVAQEHELFPILKFALFTGMRAGEISALRWDCVRWGENSTDPSVLGSIVVRRSRCQKTGVVRETTKNGDNREIPILREAGEVLQELNRVGSYVFGGSKPLETKHLSRDFKRIARLSGLRPIRFHETRHSFVSWMRHKGFDDALIAAFVGHRDLRMTDHYSHTSRNTMFLAVERFERVRNKSEISNIPTTLSLVKAD